MACGKKLLGFMAESIRIDGNHIRVGSFVLKFTRRSCQKLCARSGGVIYCIIMWWKVRTCVAWPGSDQSVDTMTAGDLLLFVPRGHSI